MQSNNMILKAYRYPKHDDDAAYIDECALDGCKNELYTDREAFEDEEGNYFCSIECFKKYYGFKEVDYKRY